MSPQIQTLTASDSSSEKLGASVGAARAASALKVDAALTAREREATREQILEKMGALLAEKDIDGGLIGGASLEAKSFTELGRL